MFCFLKLQLLNKFLDCTIIYILWTFHHNCLNEMSSLLTNMSLTPSVRHNLALVIYVKETNVVFLKVTSRCDKVKKINNIGQKQISVGPDSSVGIATRYGLGGPGIEFRWEARFSTPVQTGPGAHPASYTMGTGSFSGVKRPGRGVCHPNPSSVEFNPLNAELNSICHLLALLTLIVLMWRIG